MKRIKNKNNQNIPEFDWKEYLIANTDLIDGGINNEKLALQHWRNRGKIEKRPLKTDKFDFTNSHISKGTYNY